MRRLELTRGKFALVDDADFPSLTEHRWHAFPAGKTWYAASSCGRKRVYLHRMILGAEPGMEVDHINGDGLDNRRTNLRLCSHRDNLRNQRKQNGTTSRFKGVTWNQHSRRWYAQSKVNGKRIYIGCFKSEEDAARAYDALARSMFGPYARPNFTE